MMPHPRALWRAVLLSNRLWVLALVVLVAVLVWTVQR